MQKSKDLLFRLESIVKNNGVINFEVIDYLNSIFSGNIPINNYWIYFRKDCKNPVSTYLYGIDFSNFLFIVYFYYVFFWK